jgi:hypothetical protein
VDTSCHTQSTATGTDNIIENKFNCVLFADKAVKYEATSKYANKRNEEMPYFVT